MDDAGIDAFFAVSRKAEVEGYLISGFEANTFDIFGEPVGLVLQDSLGTAAVFFDESHTLGRRDAVGLQKHHHIAHRTLIVPRGFDRFGACFANARDFVKSARVFANDLEGVGAKVVDNFLGIGLADARN